ncbi:MAG: DUF1007 family protein [Rhodospirillaceae bacterium]|nr:DUF1007 family protein [Rhodospirillaceae bacterium]
MKPYQRFSSLQAFILRSVLLGLLICLVNASFTPAMAHPHAWIDVRSTVVLDETGKMTAIDEEWLFDEYYTLFVLDDWQKQGKDLEAQLKELANENLHNLKDYNYFTEVRAAEKRLDLGTVTSFKTEMRQGRLWLQFILPLAQPVDLKTNEVSYSIFDPTYYIEMLHLEGDLIAFRGKGAEKCLGEIKSPSPTAEDSLLAAALDRNAPPDVSLGAIFAERVIVTCQ